MKSYLKLRLASILVFSLCYTKAACAESGSLDGFIHTSDGKPLSAATVILQNAEAIEASHTTADKNGAYRFDAVSPGTYVVMATDNAAVLASATVKIENAQDVHQDLDAAIAQTLNVVIGQKRDQARANFSPTTGTTAYKIDQHAIDTLPEGEDTPLDKVLLQAPGVAEDSAASGSLHIRGEHANLQYRLNGILLPDGISGFGDTIDSHIIGSATLLDGTLPAQYGFHTAGVIDITTKNGFQNSGTADIMGGSNGTLQPSVSYGGTEGSTEYFLAASHLSSDLGIENPTRNENAIHDHTEQNKQFAYASYLIDPMQRLELIAGNSISYFQIPNNPNQVTAGYQLNGATTFDSANLNERQFESNQYATVAWQGSADDIDIQFAPYVRNSDFTIDPIQLGIFCSTALPRTCNIRISQPACKMTIAGG